MKRISSIVCIILTGTCLMAQNRVQITSKEGKLESQLKRQSPEQIESLKIDGILNNTDLLYLSKLPNLHSLDITEAELSDGFTKSLREQFIDFYTEDLDNPKKRDGHFDRGVLVLAGFRALKELKLGDDVRKLYFNQEFDRLSIPSSCQIEYVPEGRIWIPELEIDDVGQLYDASRPRLSRLEDDDAVPWYGFGYGHYQSLERIKIIVWDLHLPSKGYLKFENDDLVSWLESTIVPLKISFDREDITVLNYYLKGYHEPIPSFAAFSDATFANSSFTRFVWPEHVRRIPSRCFAYCKNLSRFDAGKVESIGAYAFMESGLTELTLPETVNEINAHAFAGSNLEIIRMNGPAPLVYKWEGDRSDNQRKYVDEIETDAVFVVPAAYRGTYSVGPWANALVMEEGARTDYEITLSKEGELKRYLTEDIVSSAQRLTIKGIMNDLEFADLQRCRSLRYLDLSNCFTIKSEYTSYQEYQTNKAILEIARIKLEGKQKDNEMQYAQGWKSTSAYQIYKYASDRAMQELKKYQGMVGEWSPSTACYLPEDAFDNLNHLREVLLPKALIELNVRMPKIRRVTLPPGLKRIGSFCFKNAPLTSIQFPSTLEYIGESCFMGCENLKRVNLKNTNVTELTFDCFQDSGVEVLKAPRGLKSLYNGENFSRARNALVVGGASMAIPEIYFYTSTPPSGLSGTAGIKTIHIPHGYKVGWVSKIDLERTALVDDVYPDREDDEASVGENEVVSAGKEQADPSAYEDEPVFTMEEAKVLKAKMQEVPPQEASVTEENDEKNEEKAVSEEKTIIEDVEAKELLTKEPEKESKKPEKAAVSRKKNAEKLPHTVIKFGASALNLSALQQTYALGGSLGFYNVGDSRIGGELGAYLCPGFSPASLVGVDVSMVLRVANGIYPQIGVGFFSYKAGSEGSPVTRGLCAGAGLTFVMGGRFCLGLGVKYYPEIDIREVTTISTTPGPDYEFPWIRQVISGGLAPFVSLGLAF